MDSIMDVDDTQISHITNNIAGNFTLDEAVIEALPKGTKVVAANIHGKSHFNTIAIITGVLSDGSPEEWLVKSSPAPYGRDMAEGEFESLKALHNVSPNFVSQPHAWGKYKNEHPETYFIVSEFLDMTGRVPDIPTFAAHLADLHKRSVSPSGKFGFHVTTIVGNIGQHVAWDSSWQSYYTSHLKHYYVREIARRGRTKTLDILSQSTFTKVIPRLLGALQSNGRSIKPSLLHGDLWEGNMGVICDTGRVVVFDSGAFYGHHEYDVAFPRYCDRPELFKEFIPEYLKYTPKDEPIEDFEDRLILYNLCPALWMSTFHEGKEHREKLIRDMKHLVGKYAPEDLVAIED